MLSYSNANNEDPFRPDSQSSIQSSNSGLIQINEPGRSNFRRQFLNATANPNFANQKVLNIKADPEILRSPEDELISEMNDMINFEDYNISILQVNQDSSPLLQDDLGYRSLDPSNIVVSCTDSTGRASALEILHDMPNSCFPFAYLKLTAELGKNSSVTESTISEYTSSSKLSPVNAFNYEDLSPLSKKAFSRRKVIEEIIETEESYLSCLKMLSGIYLESIISKGNNGIPIKQINGYIEILIENHHSFLRDLRNLYSITYRQSIDPTSLSPSFNLRAEGLLSSSSPLMAALVARLVSEKAISVYIYQEYSSLHDLVLKLVDSKEDDPELGLTLTRGYQNFLEASQNETDRFDLSFASLIQKPVQRISKYKLFLDTLAKLTTVEEDEECHQEILDCAVKVDYSIREINRYGSQEKFRSNQLFQNLEFGSTTLKFPVEYLGLPLLMGSLYISWVGQDKQIQSQIVGVFLFKTHLILAVITKSNKFEVLFLVPLSVSNFVDYEHDINGGIYCSGNNANTFKILFEHSYSIFEILFICSSEAEYKTWKDKIQILINEVNGPYKLNYTSSKFNEECGTSASTVLPPNILSFDAKLDKVKSKSRSDKGVFNRCYFRTIIPITIEHVEESFSSLRFNKYNPDLQMVQLRQVERARVDYVLEDFWSEELLPSSISSKRNLSGLKSVYTTSSKGHKRFHSSKSTTSTVGSINKSLMRRTSIVFGDALKSLFYGDAV